MTTNPANTTNHSRHSEATASNTTMYTDMPPIELARCQVCGYRAVWRDGFFVHEAAALFTVIIFGCDNPAIQPSTHDSQPTPPSPIPLPCEQSPHRQNRVHTTVISALNTHTTRQCAICGGPWPCPHALLAEPNPAVLSPPPKTASPVTLATCGRYRTGPPPANTTPQNENCCPTPGDHHFAFTRE